jgi:integrase
MPAPLKSIVTLAYSTGKRPGEILGLTWGWVDLKEGFIPLRLEEFKTREGRLVPLNQELVEMLNPGPRGLPGVRVFADENQSATSSKRACTTAVKKAG